MPESAIDLSNVPDHLLISELESRCSRPGQITAGGLKKCCEDADCDVADMGFWWGNRDNDKPTLRVCESCRKSLCDRIMSHV